jgi:hypothetical protein
MTEEVYDEATILDMIFNYLKSQGLEPEYKGFGIKVQGKQVEIYDHKE